MPPRRLPIVSATAGSARRALSSSVADPPLGIWGPIFAAFGFFLHCIFFRDVSGAIINPAVAFGLWIVGIIEGNQEKKWNIVLYVLSELIGAFLSGYFTHFVMWRQRIMARGTRLTCTPHMMDSPLTLAVAPRSRRRLWMTSRPSVPRRARASSTRAPTSRRPRKEALSAAHVSTRRAISFARPPSSSAGATVSTRGRSGLRRSGCEP